MSDMTLEDLSKRMREMDFAMLLTRTDNGEISGRPMSNNGDVEYDGDSYFFSYEQTRTIADITREPKVALSFAGDKGLFGKPPLFIAIEGRAELIRDKSMFEEHWTRDLDRWFENGIDTPGMVLIKVRAERVRYWDGEEGGEVPLR
jgi:general stress protein 26